MFILAPVVILFFVALLLLVLHNFRPNFKYPWMVAAVGAALALAAVFAWHFQMPKVVSLPAWHLQTISAYYPSWLVDDASWTYSLALAALAAAVLWTSVVRAESHPLTWAGILLLSALGILSVIAGNPATLILSWTAIDLAEVLILIRSTEGEKQSQSVIIAFAIRLLGTALVIWANTLSISGGAPMDFQSIPARAGIYLLLAAGLRLGVLPLHLPYRQENILRRGLGTTLRLVSAASSLAMLARIPPASLISPLTPFLVLLTAIPGIYAGWKWLRASDELLGRPFWVLGMASLAVAASLRASPQGSVAWGVTLILSGCFIFLFSARQRSLIWLPILVVLGISALPFSITAVGWVTGNRSSWLFLIALLPVQALLMAGFIRHALHPGETSFESQAKWTKVIYPTGLFVPVAIQIMLGLWGWSGARTLGLWPAALAAMIMAAGLTALTLTVLVHTPAPAGLARWSAIPALVWIRRIPGRLFHFLGQAASLVTSTLEGEGGVLWSLLLLVLILSLLFTGAK